MIAINHAGHITYHTSSSVRKGCYDIFSDDVEARFLQSAGMAHLCHTSLEEARQSPFSEINKDSEVGEHHFALKIGDRERVGAYYHAAFCGFLQFNCRAICKPWIDVIEPKKQVKHPYNGGESTKPDWWPAGVIHKEPDHLKKPDRVQLLVHIIRTAMADKLLEAGKEVRRKIKPKERWNILEEICTVRRMEERYERGEIGERRTPATSPWGFQLQPQPLVTPGSTPVTEQETFLSSHVSAPAISESKVPLNELPVADMNGTRTQLRRGYLTDTAGLQYHFAFAPQSWPPIATRSTW
ncbi:uncharacterized protein CIMG_13171 [Coccidioides immitis RS]|uniref:Subtelomeric hrmA-associated cluster protein AFUB-079030/YDR124W-like helical bundle domain-containing protein n=1 Tax=Coccidioides immitis (strain RS) TaxID=246410 RepID=A0A0E1RVJ9_COCIM|nr:uncharacterized protein CIMG_13171 [Coccidioides immitis RS]EAS30007.2 hypothetical protein CIMG_13171 [Coccidioides immitis RS]